MTLNPIETRYRGYRFRSRLEARWAVFFQTLGVPWEYEPEGFRLSTGQWYLPDFRVKLTDHVLWAEVKPSGADESLLWQFIQDSGSDGTPLTTILQGTVLHEIPDPDDVAAGIHGPNRDDFLILGDNFYQFCVCLGCNAVGFQYSGLAERIECGCGFSGGRCYTNDAPRILQAYAAARAARFEHGEYGDGG